MPFALNPNVAAILKIGPKHHQYNQALMIYERQKYEYDVAQNKAQSGELDGKHPFHMSKAESDAMAPILAKRKAEEKQAEDQRRKEIGQKNPYKLQLEDAKTGIEGLESVNLGNGSTEYFKNEGGRRVAVNPARDKGFDNEYFRQKSIADGSYGAGLAIPQELRDQAKRFVAYKDKQREGIASKAELIDSVNDPYNKIQADRAREQHATLKEQAALQKDAQAKRDAAAAEIAKEYMENPSQYESNHGKPAADAAGKIARSYLDQKFRKAGVDGVPLGGDIFDPEGKMVAPGTPAVAGQTAGQTPGAAASGSSSAATGQSSTATSSSRNASDLLKGGTSKLARVINYVANTQPAATTSSATSGAGSSASQQSTPSAPATPQGPTYDPSKKYDHIKHAQWIMSLPEDERKRQIATMDDFQKDFVEKSIDAVKHHDQALKNVDDTREYWKKYDKGLEERGMLGYERASARAKANITPLDHYYKWAMDTGRLKPPPGWGGQDQSVSPAEKQPAPSYPAYSVPPVEATTAGERASQAVQSSVIPRRSNEPSPDWGVAYDAAKEALAGPAKAISGSKGADESETAWIKPAASRAISWFTNPYGIGDKPSASTEAPPPDGSEDEKDPAVIARRLLNTPSAQY